VLAEQAARKKQGLNAETLQQDRDHGDHRDLGWLPAGTGRRRSWREPLHRK
jgi:hypothetical protein